METEQLSTRERDERQQCVDLCMECHKICIRTSAHCLLLGGAHADPSHQRTLLDCAEMCQTAANMLLRESPLHVRTCAACADFCLRCAQSCEGVGPEDEQMKACARLCRRCAAACKRMARS